MLSWNGEVDGNISVSSSDDALGMLEDPIIEAGSGAIKSESSLGGESEQVKFLSTI